MEVEYSLTLQDVTAFVRYHRKHGPKPKPHFLARLVGIVLGVMIAVPAILAGWLSSRPDGRWMTGFCIGSLAGQMMVFFLLGLLAKLLVIPNTLRLYDRDECRWFLAWRRLRITADGFETTNEFQHLRSSWSVVWLIDSTDDHAFFYTTLQSAHIVPRRAFRDQQHFEEFIDLACRYHKGLLPRESPSTDILDALPAHPTCITRPHHP
ncbi:MAG TPA: YcxB family protein [Gemmataceae bacterium]